VSNLLFQQLVTNSESKLKHQFAPNESLVGNFTLVRKLASMKLRQPFDEDIPNATRNCPYDTLGGLRLYLL